MQFLSKLKINHKFIWKHKRTSNNQSNTKQKSNTGGITIPDFKLYYRDIAVKNSMVLAQNRHEDQCNRIEDPHMNLCSYSHLIFNKVTPNM
jgi:hypothetical protein